MNRKERRAAAAHGRLDDAGIIDVADKFIDLANRQNRKVPADQVVIALLFAAARYSAYYGKTVAAIDQHEPFVEKMVEEYRDMLRRNLADENLSSPAE